HATRSGTSPARQKKVGLWIDRLTPVMSGPGVLVAEPVAAGGRDELANFGAGCGRWLHLIIGGQGEFGKTPLWSDNEITWTGLGRNDLRLTRADLATLSKRPSLSLGITYLALGEIRRTANSVTLTYQWWSV